MKASKLSRHLKMWLCFAIVAFGGGMSNLFPAPKASAAATVLTVDADHVVAPMKKEIRGTNIGLWTRNEFHPVSNRTEQYVNLIKEAGISLIRFPAGAEADYAYWDRTNSYEWHVGPSPYIRTITADIFDSFMSLVHEVDADAIITVNAKINNKDMAADMVRYANLEKGYNIKYWEIGNEPEFFAAPHNVTALEYAARIKEYADAMKAVDPSIIVMGPANAQPTQFTGWTKPILAYLADNDSPVDAISTHWYPLWGGQTNPNSSSYATIDNLLAYDGPDYANSYIGWASQFTNTTPTDNLVSYRDQYAPGALIGITELGQVTGGNEGAGIGDTMAGALWLGDVLGRLAYHEMDYVTQFLLQGNQAYGLMDMNKNLRPSYYLYPMFKRYFGDQMVETSSSDNQNFTIWASKQSGNDDKLYLMIINKHQTDSLDATIQLSHFDPHWNASSWVLTAPAVTSIAGANINGVQALADGTLPEIAGNTVSGVSDSFTRSYPAHSITFMELTKAGATEAAPARYFGQFADAMNERKSPSDWPGSLTDTPQGWGKIYRTGTAGWTVNLPESGEYSFTVRAYGEGEAPSFQVKLNGQNVTGGTFAPGAAWAEYEGSLGTVAAGAHTIEILNNSSIPLSNVNVAHIDIVGAAPGGFALSAPADDSTTESTLVTLNWSQSIDGRPFAPFGADSYTIVVADNPALTNPIIHTTVQSTSHQIGHLDGNTTYYWTVTAANANGSTAADAVFSFTTPELIVPSAPVRYLGQYAGGMNERRTSTDWPGNQVDTPEGWGKIWRTATAEWAVHFPVTGEYDFTIRAFGEGEAPSFQVKIDGQIVPDAAFNADDSWNSYSGSFGTVTAGIHFVQITNTSQIALNNIDIAHIDIMGAAPGKFSLTSPVNNATTNSTAVALDWTQFATDRSHAPFGADHYTLIVADNAALENPVIHISTTETNYLAEGLESNQTYYWNVIAGNANGTTEAVTPFKFTTPSQFVPISPVRYLGQYADVVHERRTASDSPGNASDTPQGWGKIWRTGTGIWTVNFPETGTYDFRIRAYGEGAAPTFQVRLNGEDLPNSFHAANNSWSDYEGSVSVAAGTHSFEIHNNSTIALNNINVAHIEFFGAAPGPFDLMSPADMTEIDTPIAVLDWTQTIADKTFAPQAAANYTVLMADNASFDNPIVNATVTGTSHQVAQLQSHSTYYWKVIANNANGSTTSSQVFSFTTGELQQLSAAVLHGPSQLIVGQPIDIAVGVAYASEPFSILEAEIHYDPNKIAFATELNGAGQPVLAEHAVTAVQNGYQVLTTGIKPSEGKLYVVLARTGTVSLVDGNMFELHGMVKENAAAGTAIISVAKLNVSLDGGFKEYITDNASIAVQIMLADLSDLLSAIATANSIRASAVQGTQPGQYPAEAISTLETAIAAATSASANPQLTPAEAAAAIAALQTAIAAFEASIIPALPADKSVLVQTVSTAQTKLGNAVQGEKIGQYPAAAIDALEAAIDAAQIIADKSNASQAEVDSAASALNSAISAFASQLVTLFPGQTAVTIRDLSLLAKYYGTTSDDSENWPFVEKADLFGNGEISIVELAAVARMIVSNWLEE